MRAKSQFCLSDTNITHVLCNIYSNIIQIEKIWKNIVYFSFNYYAFVSMTELGMKAVWSRWHSLEIFPLPGPWCNPSLSLCQVTSRELCFVVQISPTNYTSPSWSSSPWGNRGAITEVSEVMDGENWRREITKHKPGDWLVRKSYSLLLSPHPAIGILVNILLI